MCRFYIMLNQNILEYGWIGRSLTNKHHIEKTSKKINSWNNIVPKLSGSNWGAKTNGLCTAALSLVYSTAEYCALVWFNSGHTKKIDVELNRSMRIPLPWLPVLCNIALPDLRRLNCTSKLIICCNINSLLFQELQHFPDSRLSSN